MKGSTLSSVSRLSYQKDEPKETYHSFTCRETSARWTGRGLSSIAISKMILAMSWGQCTKPSSVLVGTKGCGMVYCDGGSKKYCRQSSARTGGV